MPFYFLDKSEAYFFFACPLFFYAFRPCRPAHRAAFYFLKAKLPCRPAQRAAGRA
jgi:hypothetical protein